MALGTTNISTILVQTALGSSSHILSILCTEEAINKWSKYKPVAGPYPASTTGQYAIDVDANWNYIRPTNTFRIGDFRQYKHDALPPFELTFYPGASVVNIAGFTFAITVNENDITIENLLLNDWYLGVKLLKEETPYWYSATYPLSERSTEIGARTVVVSGLGEGTYDWEVFVSSLPVTGGGEPTYHTTLPVYGSYIVSGSSTITLVAPYVDVINNISGLAASFVIDGNYVDLYCLNPGEYSGVGYFYDDSNSSLLDTYQFTGVDITVGIPTGISPPTGYGNHLTVRVESS